MNEQQKASDAALSRMSAHIFDPDCMAARDIAVVRAELDQLRQRLAEVEAELAECREILNAELDRDVESKITVRNLVVIAVNSLQRERTHRQQAEAKLTLAEQDARRYRHARTLTEFRDFQESPDQLDRRLDRYIAAIDASQY